MEKKPQVMLEISFFFYHMHVSYTTEPIFPIQARAPGGRGTSPARQATGGQQVEAVMADQV